MNFDLTEEQQAIKQMAREFARKEITPRTRELYEKGEFPRALLAKMADVGFYGCLVPEEYGGSALGFVSQVLIVEEIAMADPGIASTMNVQGVLLPTALLQWGTEEQKQRYLPEIVACRKIGCWGLTEPNAGSDAAALQTRAVRDGDDYVLNGQKVFITHGSVADFAIIFAKTDPAAKHHGISAFLVDMQSPGVTARPLQGKYLNPLCPVAEVFMTDVRVPAANLLGPENEGFKVAMQTLSWGRVTVPARSVGLAKAALAEALRYANEREAFGQKIGNFQMIKKQIADMVVEVEAAQWLVYRAAWLKDMGRPSHLDSSIAKLYATEAAVRVADNAMQIFGGYAFTDDYPIGRIYARTRISMTGEGSSNIQRVIIAEDALGWKKANRHEKGAGGRSER